MPYRYQNSLAAGLKPDPLITFTEWANRSFVLPKESSAEYGKYRSSRTPFVEEILDELSPTSPTQVVVVIKPTQCAGTTIALIFLCGIAALYPGPCLFMQPTDLMVRSFSKKKLTPTIKLIPELKKKIKDPKSRDSGNTILQKDFPGGSWLLSGSNSGASYRSESIKYLVLDDFDGFEIDIEGEGSPEELADRRTGTFPGRKIYINTTTTIKDISNGERAFEKSSQGYFNVPCPHCGHYQYLVWGGRDSDFGIKFERDKNGLLTDVWYQCEYCKNRINEYEKPWMIENGEYIHEYPERKVRGFRYNALVTPLGWINSWGYIAEKFLEASAELKKGNTEKYITWLNSFMSEPWEGEGDQPEWSRLSARCEPYSIMIVPMGGLFLTVGVDTQDDRLAVIIKAWGRGEESWLVYWTELIGDPAQPEVWIQLDNLLNRSYRHESGTELYIESMAVDSQGHRTQAVYNYCRTRYPRVIAIQGSSQPGKPVLSRPTYQDVTWNGKKIKKGVQLWTIGTEIVKSTIYARLNSTKKGPGYYHFPIGIEDEYFMQLTGEKLVTRYKDGFPVKKWVRTRGRVEALDCEVYAYAAAIRAGMARIDWNSLEKSIIGESTNSEPKAKKKKPKVAKSNWMSR